MRPKGVPEYTKMSETVEEGVMWGLRRFYKESETAAYPEEGKSPSVTVIMVNNIFAFNQDREHLPGTRVSDPGH
jgi:hypothetical protein